MLTHDAASSSHVKETLIKLPQLWRERATVNHGLVDHNSLRFQPQRADFPEALLPFRNHPRWEEAPDDLKAAALSYAWAIYNLKTVYVECDIVTPACEDLIKRPFGSAAARYELQQVMSEALLDEALHTKMSITACNYIYRHRNLVPLDYTKFNLVMWRERLLADCESEAKRRLAKFALATASETLITDYLKTLASDTDIQPICHQVTRSHAMDEWGHSSVFSIAAEHVVSSLSENERRWFASVIPKTVEMFSDNELGAWAAAFGLLSFPHCEEILGDTLELDKINVYTNAVTGLLEKLGLDAFHG